jgi:hypothetical protein
VLLFVLEVATGTGTGTGIGTELGSELEGFDSIGVGSSDYPSEIKKNNNMNQHLTTID